MQIGKCINDKSMMVSEVEMHSIVYFSAELNALYVHVSRYDGKSCEPQIMVSRLLEAVSSFLLVECLLCGRMEASEILKQATKGHFRDWE